MIKVCFEIGIVSVDGCARLKSYRRVLVVSLTAFFVEYIYHMASSQGMFFKPF